MFSWSIQYSLSDMRLLCKQWPILLYDCVWTSYTTRLLGVRMESKKKIEICFTHFSVRTAAIDCMFRCRLFENNFTYAVLWWHLKWKSGSHWPLNMQCFISLHTNANQCNALVLRLAAFYRMYGEGILRHRQIFLVYSYRLLFVIYSL